MIKNDIKLYCNTKIINLDYTFLLTTDNISKLDVRIYNFYPTNEVTTIELVVDNQRVFWGSVGEVDMITNLVDRELAIKSDNSNFLEGLKIKSILPAGEQSIDIKTLFDEKITKLKNNYAFSEQTSQHAKLSIIAKNEGFDDYKIEGEKVSFIKLEQCPIKRLTKIIDLKVTPLGAQVISMFNPTINYGDKLVVNSSQLKAENKELVVNKIILNYSYKTGLTQETYLIPIDKFKKENNILN